MDETLNQSLKLLEDAVSKTSKSMVRTSKFMPRTQRQSLLRQHIFDIGNRPDDSLTINPHEFQDIMGPRITFSESFSHDSVLKTTQKSAEYLDKLFIDFYEITQMHKSAPQIFQTIADYIQTCTDKLNEIIELDSKSLGKTRETAALENLWLENERNIWRLIYCLYQDRLTTEKNPEIETRPLNILTEKQCVENLYKTDALLRECQLVVDWIERNAADQSWTRPKIGHFTDKTIGWENTFHELTSDKTIVFPSTRPLVKSLDPDAPNREKGFLHDLDIEDDKRLCKQVFYEIRCGKLNEAQSLCIHCGHPWKAACLEGWRLYHDPNYDNKENQSTIEPCEGNPNRDLWKLMAWKLSENEKLNEYWRASLGILCGNLKPVLSVCQGWEDFLWVYLRVMIDIRVESEIRDTLLKKYQAMPDEYWRNRFSLDNIFEKILEHSNSQQHIIQQFVIMDQPTELLNRMKEWIQGTDTPLLTKVSSQLVRLLAHIVLVFRELGISGNEEPGDKILEKYVDTLIEGDKKDFVAFYTSTLPQPNQITIYAKFLENITDDDERKELLCNAEEAGLDVEAITKRIVENIRKTDSAGSTSNLTNEITPGDLAKISALSWLTFYESQRLEALYQTNALIRYFLANNKLDAARQAFNKIPADSVDIITSNYENDTIPAHMQSIIKEFLCHKAYLDANESFSDWFHHFHHGKPKEPVPISENAGFTERVAYDHRVSQYKAELDRWKLTMDHRTRNTKTILYNVLLFPEGGWLEDSTETDECRARQLQELRTMCVPKVVLLLHTLMHAIGDYKECIQLADLIANETKQLYKIFNKESLSEILIKIAESSLALMEQKKDPWGYDLGS